MPEKADIGLATAKNLADELQQLREQPRSIGLHMRSHARHQLACVRQRGVDSTRTDALEEEGPVAVLGGNVQRVAQHGTVVRANRGGIRQERYQCQACGRYRLEYNTCSTGSGTWDGRREPQSSYTG